MVTMKDLAGLIDDPAKRTRAIETLSELLEGMANSRGSSGSHHFYPGGLLDHTMLTTILAILDVKSAVSEIAVLYDIDDVIISALFHEIEKVDGNAVARNGSDAVKTKFDVVRYLEGRGLLDENVRDGILHSHGGYSPYHEKEPGPTGILIHKCCMIASRVVKSKDLTRKLIADLSGYFCKKE